MCPRRWLSRSTALPSRAPWDTSAPPQPRTTPRCLPNLTSSSNSFTVSIPGNTINTFIVPTAATLTASFTGNPTNGSAPLTVNFIDTSTGSPRSWEWDFTNDGITDSTVQNPKHTFSSNGTYTVKLTVTSAQGSDSEVKTSYITVTGPLPRNSRFQPDRQQHSGARLPSPADRNPEYILRDRTLARPRTLAPAEHEPIPRHPARPAGSRCHQRAHALLPRATGRVSASVMSKNSNTTFSMGFT